MILSPKSTPADTRPFSVPTASRSILGPDNTGLAVKQFGRPEGVAPATPPNVTGFLAGAGTGEIFQIPREA